MLAEGVVGPRNMQNGAPGPVRMTRDGSLAAKLSGGAFQEAVERGNVYACANQAGVTSQAGLSLTTPVLTLANPAGSAKRCVLWYAACAFEVAFAAAAAIFAAVGGGLNTAAVTGTAGTVRNLKTGSAVGNGINAFTAATLPAAPVAVGVLGVGLTGAITTVPISQSIERWYNGALIIPPGFNFSLQTRTASGASAMFCEYIWEEVDE